MKIKKVNTENEAFNAYQLALTNAESQSEIATTLASYGYTPETIAEGKLLLEATLVAYNSNKKENSESQAAKLAFDEKYQQVLDTHNKHRKLAKIVFRNDMLNYHKLELKGIFPKAYVNCLSKMKLFYQMIVDDQNIQSKLIRFNVTKEEAEQTLLAIAELEKLRTDYLRENGESQEATQKKDAAFAKLDSWMSDFYAVAKIAMEDQPQLLEALGILVRS